MLDKQKNRGELFPYLGNKNVRWGSFDISDLAQMRFETNEYDRYGLKYGDLVVCEGGEPGRCSIWKDEIPGMKIQKALHRIRAKKELDNYFIYYWFLLAGRNGSLEPFFTGTTIKHLTGKAIEELEIPLPPKAEQEFIVCTLRSLDDKIELNRQTNETLEALARALFKDWFVDFGPTRTKAEGGAPYLAPELWALFPDALDDEDKPVGWRSFRLDELATRSTIAVSPTITPEKLFEHYSLPAFDKGQNPVIELGKEIKSNKTLVPNGAVLVSKLNPEISRVWIPEAPDDDIQQVASTEFLALSPSVLCGRGTLYCLFRDTSFIEKMMGMVTGTSKSHQRVSPTALLKLDVSYGLPAMFSVFEDQAGPLISRWLHNRTESRTLAQTRDLLLPRLMSGEIRLRDAEREVEAVL
jgi:type I restriction enzyme S subunit